MIGEIELDLAQSIKRRQIESMRRGRKGCKKREREKEWNGKGWKKKKKKKRRRRKHHKSKKR